MLYLKLQFKKVLEGTYVNRKARIQKHSRDLVCLTLCAVYPQAEADHRMREVEEARSEAQRQMLEARYESQRQAADARRVRRDAQQAHQGMYQQEYQGSRRDAKRLGGRKEKPLYLRLEEHFLQEQAAFEQEKRRRYEEQAAALRQVRPHHLSTGQVTIGKRGVAAHRKVGRCGGADDC